MSWITIALQFVWGGIKALLGSGKSEADKERASGEELGKAEVERDNAQSSVSELQKAAGAEPAPPPVDGLRGSSDPAAAPYRPGPD